jgi:uncharacterized protein
MELPFLGLGLSSNAQAGDVPHPYRLLEHQPNAFDYLEYSAPLNLEEAKAEATLLQVMLSRRQTTRLVYHPVHLNLWGPQLESAERLAHLASHVEAVASPWVSNDVGWWHVEGQPLPGYQYLSPPLTAESLAMAVAHAGHVAAAMPVPLLLENPVVMAAHGPLHVLDYMERLTTATGTGMVLDIGHLLSHQLTRQHGLTAGLDGFDFSRVVQLHVAGGAITTRAGRAVYVDDHVQPVRDEVWHLLQNVLPRCQGLKAVTFEGDGHSDASALSVLRRLREVWQPARLEPLFSSKSMPGQLDEALAWQHFEAVHQGRGDDRTGAQAELDYRLAVVAEVLDASVPLARLSVAPRRADLAAFLAAPEFRESLEAGRDVVDGFARYANRVGRGVPGVEPLVMLDVWARTFAPRRAATPPPPGHVALAAGVGVAQFPLDLREALHAATAVSSHLRRRAGWSDSGFELNGLDAVYQAAARASAGPWRVVLQRRGHGAAVRDDPEAVALASALSGGAVLFHTARAGPGGAVLSAAVRAGWVVVGEG